MQCTVIFFTEVMNLLLLCGFDDTMELITNYIALGVIAEIDNIYASSLHNFKLK